MRQSAAMAQRPFRTPFANTPVLSERRPTLTSTSASPRTVVYCPDSVGDEQHASSGGGGHTECRENINAARANVLLSSGSRTVGETGSTEDRHNRSAFLFEGKVWKKAVMSSPDDVDRQIAERIAELNQSGSSAQANLVESTITWLRTAQGAIELAARQYGTNVDAVLHELDLRPAEVLYDPNEEAFITH